MLHLTLGVRGTHSVGYRMAPVAGLSAEQKNFLSLPEIESILVGPVACSLVTVRAELTIKCPKII